MACLCCRSPMTCAAAPSAIATAAQACSTGSHQRTISAQQETASGEHAVCTCATSITVSGIMLWAQHHTAFNHGCFKASPRLAAHHVSTTPCLISSINQSCKLTMPGCCDAST
jgi:hypothetical protein